MAFLHITKTIFIFCLVLLIIDAKSSYYTIASKENGSNFELLILHSNDMHGHFEETSRVSSKCSDAEKAANECYGGFARIAHVVRKSRKKSLKEEGPPVLYLNAGDTYSGTIWFSIYTWEIAASFLNILQPDAMCLGNHELDKGVSGLVPFLKNVTFPVLVSNIDITEEPTLNAVTNLKSSVILDINNTKIGIVGYLTPDTKHLVPGNRIKFLNEINTVQEEVDILKAKGVKIIIALGHSGYETDQRIAKEVLGIDLVIGGHTNTFLWNGNTTNHEPVAGPYPTIVHQDSGKKVPVLQAYAYTKYLGNFSLKFDSEGEILSYEGHPILLDSSIPEEQDVLDLLESYRPGIKNYSSTIFGKSTVLLNAVDCRIKECNIGNLITDAVAHAYNIKYNLSTDDSLCGPIVLVSGGTIRSSINANVNISRADILNTLPFGNIIVELVLTGKVLKKALEWSVYKYDHIEKPGYFLQFSALRVEYNVTHAKGNRVVSAHVICNKRKEEPYSPLEDNKEYKVLVTEFMFHGGDNYNMFKEENVSNNILLLNVADELGEYISITDPVHPDIEGRITIHY